MPLEAQKVPTYSGTDQQLIILTSIKDLKVEFINNTLASYCPVEADSIVKEAVDLYKDLIHPVDYPEYLTHLNSFMGSSIDEEKNFFLRLKNKEGGWNSFCFRNRIYKWKHRKEAPVVLSLAELVPQESMGIIGDYRDKSGPRYDILNREYKHLIESLDEAFCVIELIFNKENQPVDYLFLRTNTAFEKQINLKKVVGKTIKELIPDYGSQRLEAYGKVALTGESIRFEFRAEKIDNSYLDAYVFRVGQQDNGRVAVIFRNITERKIAEEKLLLAKQALEEAKASLEKKALLRQKDLKESKELLQTVFDTTNQAIAVFEVLYNSDGTVKDFRFIKVNKVLLEMYLQSDPLGKTYLETTKYGVEMGIFDALKKVMTTGTPMDQEFYHGRDGYNHWFRITARPQKNLLIATMEDISERKAESRELEETVRFKQELVRTSPETIMIVNLNTFCVRYINKDIFPEVGMTMERIEGMPLADILPFIHPRDREKVMDLHKKLLKASIDDIYDMELRLKLKGTNWEWFSVRGKVFHRRDESWVDEYVLLVRNVTAQKKTKEALLKAEKLSIQGEVARTFAHELRNPLASIKMATQVLQMKLKNGELEGLENYLDIQSRSTETLNNLVTHLLNSSNYSPAVLEKQDLAEIVNEAIDKAADRIYLSGIKVISNCSGPYYILADKEKLMIALLNIIVNASEATPPGEGVIELEIAVHKTDYVLSITDNGHGLEQEQIDRLFDAFYTNKESGVGVGLNSVKNILEEHDAQIRVWSKPNEGASFKLFFHNAEIE